MIITDMDIENSNLLFFATQNKSVRTIRIDVLLCNQKEETDTHAAMILLRMKVGNVGSIRRYALSL